ncbi:conserved hypothetical protein [Tenacibaculum dicentrarchi]|nr:conserved hypothetical protein [Tenacibaculum dicentrarchi]
MKYYIINWDYDNFEVIGHNPQVTLKKGYNPDLEDRIWKVRHFFFPNFIPDVELKLHKKAKRTNFIERNDTYFGMFVDFKFKDVLKMFNLPPHAFYPLKVYHKGELLDYYWFHYISDTSKYIDVKKSSAQIFKKFEFKIESIVNIIDLGNIDDYEKSLPRQKELILDKVFFNKDFPNYDVFDIRKVGYSGHLISEPLLNALQKAGMTGFTAIPYDKIICE